MPHACLMFSSLASSLVILGRALTQHALLLADGLNFDSFQR